MYNDIIRKDTVEENWLEFLKWTKKQADEFNQFQEEQAKRYKDHPMAPIGLGSCSPTYYNTSIDAFWSWYLAEKL